MILSLAYSIVKVVCWVLSLSPLMLYHNHQNQISHFEALHLLLSESKGLSHPLFLTSHWRVFSRTPHRISGSSHMPLWCLLVWSIGWWIWRMSLLGYLHQEFDPHKNANLAGYPMVMCSIWEGKPISSHLLALCSILHRWHALGLHYSTFLISLFCSLFSPIPCSQPDLAPTLLYFQFIASLSPLHL